MIKKICVISAHYPSKDNPVYAFVGTLINAIADSGIECHVISPDSRFETKNRIEYRVETTKNGSKVHVYCPPYICYPNRNIFGFNTYKLTVNSKRRAIKKIYDKNIITCDAIYSHFIDSATFAAWLSGQTGIPAFAAIGESNLTMKQLSYTLYRSELHTNIKGVISVSSELKQEARKLDIFSELTPIEVFPNCIDTDIFKSLNREKCRERLGVGNDDFIISFVGSFVKRKGFDKLLEAISHHPEWKCILIGAGELEVTLPSSQVVFCGRIPHDQIPNYICASDVFALPTQAEGCCNAIVEAMGCGLPIISSDRPFNDDILDETNSIRIDPDSTADCEDALLRIEENKKLQMTLREGSMRKGKALSITNRASRIIEFMEKCL